MNITWNKSRQKQLLKNKHCPSSGCNCIFIKLTDRVGIKIYTRKTHRDIAHDLQSKAFKHKVGPQAGEKFSIYNPKHAVAIKIKQHIKRRCPHTWDRRWPLYCYLTEVVRVPEDGISEKQYLSLFKRLEKVGFSTNDISLEHNVGILKGRAVCYDFDPYSMNTIY
jgi:hypothetical protein